MGLLTKHNGSPGFYLAVSANGKIKQPAFRCADCSLVITFGVNATLPLRAAHCHTVEIYSDPLRELPEMRVVLPPPKQLFEDAPGAVGYTRGVF